MGIYASVGGGYTPQQLPCTCWFTKKNKEGADLLPIVFSQACSRGRGVGTPPPNHTKGQGWGEGQPPVSTANRRRMQAIEGATPRNTHKQ